MSMINHVSALTDNCCPTTQNSPGAHRKPIRLKNLTTKAEAFDSLHLKRCDNTVCTQQVCLGSTISQPARSETNRSTQEILRHAKDFLDQYFASIRRSNTTAHLSRWEQVQKEVATTGTYQLSETELIFGAKLAWRNSVRCIGRIQWSKLQVFDCRYVTTTSGMFEALCNHIKYSTNKGNIREMSETAWDKSLQPPIKYEKDTLIRFKISPEHETVDDADDLGNDKRIVTYQPVQIETDERGGWTNKLDFLFSCISLSVGLGNVWRFPYLCYKNGGGAFLITYSIAMIFCGIPMFYQEVAIGQYLGSGGMTFVGQLCPILKGVGFATMTIVFLLDVYYCVIIAWTIFYIISTFAYLPELPWSGCDNWWNTENCYIPSMNSSSINSTKHTTSVEEYFDRRVLGISNGIEQIGGIQWSLFVCLVFGWIIIYSIIKKGLHQSGKIIWFTALFPYIILLILLGRAVTLNGASDGLLYFITPRWSELLTPGPWMDGASQIFFAYSIGCGALPALGSYNKFHHNCYKDSVITCIINTLTSLLAGVVTFSILGYIAYEQNSDVSTVVKSGPGLVFLTYPEVVLKLPGAPFWTIVFFFMLITLGIDSQFCLVESFITGLVDNWSEELRPHRNKFTIIICCIMFLLGIPMVTHGGMYVFQLMDYYSASGMSLLWVCFFQTVAISWIFGVEKLSDCIEQMIGKRPNQFWKICWKYFAPIVMITIFVSQCINYTNLTYANYQYPKWAEIIGLTLSLSSMIWVPIYALYYITFGSGTLLENIRDGIQPKIKQRKISICDKRTGLPITESNIGLISPSQSFI